VIRFATNKDRNVLISGEGQLAMPRTAHLLFVHRPAARSMFTVVYCCHFMSIKAKLLQYYSGNFI